jgi:hypothetical protein
MANDQTPIQEAVAYLWSVVDYADPFRYTRWADAIEAQTAALKAARDLIQNVIDAETTVSLVDGEVTRSLPEPDYDAVLAQIDGAANG